MKKSKMPIGIDDFSMLRKNDFYYVDKTGMIRELLDSWGQVNLFTRPRRFGKSIIMSMLKYYFEIGTDKSLFDGLEISKETELCEAYMGQYPIISITLKQVTGNTYEMAEENIRSIIRQEARRFSFLPESNRLDEEDKKDLEKLRSGTALIDSSLYMLSYLLYKHYGKKVIILIDEYDAPLQKAYENGYYEEMVQLIRQFFGYALKSNEALYFSVLTGCMRVSKESIFSDLNNPKLYTLLDDRCDERFGFTDIEVQQLLTFTGLEDYYETVKDWYDGYQIGQSHIYCPWDVINYCDQLLNNTDKTPGNYWANVSENHIVYDFVDMADETTRFDLETLSEGKSVDKELSLELTYKDIEKSIDNLWSVLFTTGYLTQRGRNADGTYRLAIPNSEVRNIFNNQIRKWFLAKTEGGLQDLYNAFDKGDADAIESQINTCLKYSISFMDGGNTEELKESFYHGLLLGLLRGRRGWVVKSNREAGDGRADILLLDRTKNTGIIIEVKHAVQSSMLYNKALEGLQQIDNEKYEEFFLGYDIKNIFKYGIAFSKRTCKVVKEK